MGFFSDLTHSAQRGLLIAGIAVVISCLVGYLAFKTMHDAIIQGICQDQLQLAHVIGASVEYRGGTWDAASELWADVKPKYPGMYLCAVDTSGQVVYHSKNPERVGKNTGAVPLLNRSEGTPKTVGALAAAGLNYAGLHINKQGERQVAAFGFRPVLGALIIVHVPAQGIQKKITQLALPWGIGFGVVTFVLWPVALGGIHRAYRRSQNELEVMHEKLQVEHEQKDRLQAQLLQSQKMEAVGQLAGGVAHDFNNLLTSILGGVHFLKQRMGSNDPRLSEVEEIRKSGEQGTALTRQLLAFSRKQVVHPRDIDVEEALLSMVKMLRRLLGSHIDISVSCESGLSRVWIDPTQIEIVILNLALNARDAMVDGGKLIFEVQNYSVSPTDTNDHTDLAPGAYVLMAVCDTGTGMDAETLSRVFEPFFTTKEQGQGTGLGLATVYGIVRQSEGHIAVHSEVGKGTTFNVYLPCARVDLPVMPAPVDPAPPLPGSETVLLVEDEKSVSRTIERILLQWGYRVLAASDGREALTLYGGRLDEVGIVITDVVMPEMDGPELVAKLIERGHRLPVIYMSGYMEGIREYNGQLLADALLLQKPFETDELLRHMRKLLDL